jgi:putative membrane protein
MLAAEKPDPARDSTDMAVDRTVMAADRSLMAWVRTGLSLITFGFTIYKFLEYSREHLLASGEVPGSVSSPKVIGLFMIGVGILSLVLGTVENVTTIRGLRERHEFKHPRYALLMSAILTIFGIVLFLGILLQIKGTGSS